MNKHAEKTVFMVVGPTAVGKTSFAIELAQHLNTEIISADSRQFFQEMSIGTAVPTTEELQAVQHHFIQHISIHKPYNVFEYEQEALRKIDMLFSKHQTVVVVGGSGLYLNALAYGIDDLPDPSEETREKLNAIFQEKGVLGLQQMLQDLDPDFLQVVDKQNPNRMKRALEVCLTTGKAYSELRLGKKKERPFKIVWIGLGQERAVLYNRINERVDRMLNAGLVDEVKKLFHLRHLNALNTVGYRELFLWMEKKNSYEWAVEKIKTNSRRYAKRQMTWFNKNKDIQWIDADDADVSLFS